MNRKILPWILLSVFGWSLFTVVLCLYLGEKRVRQGEALRNATDAPRTPAGALTTPLGNSFTAIMEQVPGDRQSILESTVRFYSHNTHGVSAVVHTGSPTFVAPAWHPNRFVIGWNLPPEKGRDGKAKFIEFDPEANAIVSEYVHPAPLPFLKLPGAMLIQDRPFVAGEGGLLWLVSQGNIEVIDWAKKQVVRRQKLPPHGGTPVAVAGGCLVVVDTVTAYALDGQPGKPNTLEAGKPMSYVHSAGNLLSGLSGQDLWVLQYNPTDRSTIVRFKQPVVPEGYLGNRTYVLPQQGLVVVGLNRIGGQVDKIRLVSVKDGSLVREASLPIPGDILSYGDDHLWVYSQGTGTMSTYDLTLNCVRVGTSSDRRLLELVP